MSRAVALIALTLAAGPAWAQYARPTPSTSVLRPAPTPSTPASAAGATAVTPAARAAVTATATATAPAPAASAASLAFAPVPAGALQPPTVVRMLQQQPKQVYEALQALLASIPGRPDAYSSPAERAAFVAAASGRMQELGAIGMRGSCLRSYDADAQHMTVQVIGMPIHPLSSTFRIGEERFLRQVGLDYEALKRSSYVAQNVFGASSQVESTESIGYAIAVPRGEDFEPVNAWVSVNGSVRQLYFDSIGSYTTGFAMPSADARRNDKLLECLFVVRPVEPYLLEYTSRTAPTRERPEDATVHYRTMVVRLESILVANRESGQVFVRVDRTPLR